MTKYISYWDRLVIQRKENIYNRIALKQAETVENADKWDTLTADDIAAAFSPVKPNQGVYEYDC